MVLPPGERELGVQISYWKNGDTSICTAPTTTTTVYTAPPTCEPVANLTTTVNDDKTVTLNWTIPPQDTWPADCDGDIYFRFFLDGEQIEYEDSDESTTWTTPVLTTGTHTVGVQISYWKNYNQEVCTAETTQATVSITDGEDGCPPITNLAATVNEDKTVTLNWVNPPQSTWPAECDGDVYFEFIVDDTHSGSEDTDDLTSWTSAALTPGSHTVGVRISYWKGSDTNVCWAEIISTTVNVPGDDACPPVTNLTATVNGNNTVTLNWSIPAQSEWPAECEGDLYFRFYNGYNFIGDSDTDNLTSWTSAALTPGTYTLGVQISYWKPGDASICYAEIISTSVTITAGGGEVTLPYLEPFDSEPTVWLSLDKDEDTYFWNYYMVGGFMRSASYVNTVGPLTPDNWLISPNVNGVVSLEYLIAATDLNDYKEHYSVMVSSTGTDLSDFTEVFSETLTDNEANYGFENIEFKSRSMNLPADTKYVAFRHHSCTGQYWLLLDNVHFKTTPSGIAEAERKISIYPNPASDVLHIECENLKKIRLHNSVGQTVLQRENEQVLQVSSLPNGVYYLEITTTDNYRRVEKIIIAK